MPPNGEAKPIKNEEEDRNLARKRSDNEVE
jgi:hypothetical protein